MFWVGRIFDEAVLCLWAKKTVHTGVRTGCHYLISLSVRLSVCVSVSVCITFVIFTDCESCTRQISTNSGSMEAGEYGITRKTCLVARRLGLVAVAGLLWISWYVFGAAGFFFLCFCFLDFFFSRNAQGLLQVLGQLASCTSILVMRQGRGSEVTEAVFRRKSLFTPGCVQGAII